MTMSEHLERTTPRATQRAISSLRTVRARGGLRRAASAALAAALGAGTLAALLGASATEPALQYPSVARGDHVDVYHDVRVPDPYRALEDIDSPQTRAWVQAEGRLTEDYLARIPGRQAIAQRLQRIWNFERWSPPERHGAWWFYSHNDGLQNQPVVFVTADPGSPGRVLLDPNALSTDGTVSLRETAISDDGKYFAYALSDAGSDWQIWHVRDVASGKDLPDQLRWSKAGGGSWRKDDSGFYYTRYAEPQPGAVLKAANEFEKLYFHKLGTPQSQDALVYTRSDDPNWFVGGVVTDDGRYLVAYANHGDEVQNTLLVQDLTVPGAKLREIVPKPTAVFDFVGNEGRTLYVHTDSGAPRYRIIAIDIDHPEPAHWRTVVPEAPETLENVSLVGRQLIAQYLKDAHSAVRRFALDGHALGEVQLEGFGSASGFAGRIDDTATYYAFSSYTQPSSVYRLELASGKSTLWRQPIVPGFNPADYETQQVFHAGKDGARIPVYIVARKNTPRDGRQPTLLYGYGGFNISLTPSFSPAVAGWLQLGGVYAQATLRGGGEYGRAWHEAGMKTHKQNVFDDFISSAQSLIAQHWTSPQRLAILGRSNGGLLVGATLEQRPDLFAAAVAQVGVMDMLRFRDFTVGKGWESDFGSVDNPDEFRAILAYSPLQNVKPGVNYPPTLITTGDHDDRVFPAHSFKFAAAMQHADPHGNPILLRIETRAGHGQGKPTAKLIAETADIYAFVLNAMGLAQPELAGGAPRSAHTR
jgi:prolyl oligopeptidase